MKLQKMRWASWLGVGYGVFLAIFALDVFEMDMSLLEKIGGFMIHMIPSFLVWGVVWLTERHRHWGWMLYVMLALVTLVFFRTYQDRVVFMLITGPLIGLGLAAYFRQ